MYPHQYKQGSYINSQQLCKINKTIILPLILCGSETWSLTLRREHRLKEFEKRVLRNFITCMLHQILSE